MSYIDRLMVTTLCILLCVAFVFMIIVTASEIGVLTTIGGFAVFLLYPLIPNLIKFVRQR